MPDEKKTGALPEKTGQGNERNQGQVRIRLDETIARGVYSNTAFVSHSDSEFVLDFIFSDPPRRQGHVVSRVITNPRAAKKLAAGLNALIEGYEKRFGEISLPKKEAGIDRQNYH